MSDVKSALQELLEIEKSIVKLNEARKKYDEALKKFKARKEILQKSVESHMRNNGIKAINLPTGEKLQAYVRKSRPSCSKEWISNRLQDYCTSHNLNYDEIYQFIYDPIHRPQVEKNAIKKVKPRVKKN